MNEKKGNEKNGIKTNTKAKTVIRLERGIGHKSYRTKKTKEVTRGSYKLYKALNLKARVINKNHNKYVSFRKEYLGEVKGDR